MTGSQRHRYQCKNPAQEDSNCGVERWPGYQKTQSSPVKVHITLGPACRQAVVGFMQRWGLLCRANSPAQRDVRASKLNNEEKKLPTFPSQVGDILCFHELFTGSKLGKQLYSSHNLFPCSSLSPMGWYPPDSEPPQTSHSSGDRVLISNRAHSWQTGHWRHHTL